MAWKPQDRLNVLFGARDHDLEAITDYHRNRVGSVLARIDERIQDGSGAYRVEVPPTDSVRSVAVLRQRRDRNPAGGWYLVREHREWLKEQLTRAFERLGAPSSGETLSRGEEPTRRKPIRILEAGVASYVHHFSYLAVVVEALRASACARPVELVASDLCFYPLFQVETVDNELQALARKPSWSQRIALPSFRYEYEADGRPMREPRVWVDREVLRLSLASGLPSSPLTTELWHFDLASQDALGAGDQFDVVTEHYLTSMSDKNFTLMRKVRTNYAALLRPGGVLLAAAGFTEQQRDPAPYHAFMRLHADAGFACTDQSYVWDVYDLSDAKVDQLVKGIEVYTECENSLSAFVKT